MEFPLAHVILYVPRTHAERVRRALAEAGAGKLGNYDSCSFSCSGIGRFRPNEHAHPFLGTLHELAHVEEERIEVVVSRANLPNVLRAAKAVHPYEEPAIHILPMLDAAQFL